AHRAPALARPHRIGPREPAPALCAVAQRVPPRLLHLPALADVEPRRRADVLYRAAVLRRRRRTTDATLRRAALAARRTRGARHPLGRLAPARVRRLRQYADLG